METASDSRHTGGGPEPLRIEDPAQVALLLSAKARRFLAPFMRQERPATEAARRLGVPLETLMYWLRRFQQAGLLTVVRQGRRQGRAVKFYRASAGAFFIPYHAALQETPEALVLYNREPLERQLVSSLVRAGLENLAAQGEREWGVQVRPDRQGELVLQHARQRETRADLLTGQTPVYLSLWAADLELNTPDALALQQELVEVFRRYRGRAGARPYLLRLALAPKPPANAP